MLYYLEHRYGVEEAIFKRRCFQSAHMDRPAQVAFGYLCAYRGGLDSIGLPALRFGGAQKVAGSAADVQEPSIKECRLQLPEVERLTVVGSLLVKRPSAEA